MRLVQIIFRVLFGFISIGINLIMNYCYYTYSATPFFLRKADNLFLCFIDLCCVLLGIKSAIRISQTCSFYALYDRCVELCLKP